MYTVEAVPAGELGNASFLVADTDRGVGLVVDPLRDIERYLKLADDLHVKITHALDTHLHNDYVSGRRELAAEVGANTDELNPGDDLHIGDMTLRAIHTPGHTPDHKSFLLHEGGRDRALFSGGAVMLGAIARTDLFGPHLAVHLALEALSTLQVRLRALPDDIRVFPTHGGGSFCGTGGRSGHETTLGHVGGTDSELRKAQRQLLRIGFDTIAGVLDGGIDAWRSSGRELSTFETVDVEDMAQWVLSAEPMTVVDARDEHEWVAGHVPGAVHMYVPDVPHRAGEIPREAPVAVHCASGYRAGIAASLLEQAGLTRIIHVNGEYSDWDRLHLAESVPT